ncbi:hypothetical protein [Shinella sp.]|uniref:hypothetical protein n=1 Tax=Shinella sp. TaxID=1870904 RepID=UPI003F706E42
MAGVFDVALLAFGHQHSFTRIRPNSQPWHGPAIGFEKSIWDNSSMNWLFRHMFIESVSRVRASK